jgi:putative membrane protein
MQAKAKAFNPQIFLELLCYSVFAGLMLYLLDSGKYLSYVTPRMEPYLYFTAIVMGIWVFIGLGRLFQPQHKMRSAHCYVLAIPILLLLLPHSPLSTSDFSASNGGSALSGPNSYSPAPKQAPSADSGSDDSAPGSTDPAEDFSSAAPEYTADLPGLDVKNQKITVANDDFSIWLSEIYMNMEKYKGYTVVMTGFVFKDHEMIEQDEFVPARLMMSCCVADLAPAGLLCKYDKASELKAESWVTVEGTLSIGQYEYDGVQYDEPQINVRKIMPAEAVEGYVYPY